MVIGFISSLSGSEIVLLFGIVLLIIVVGHYGRNTALGYTGTVLLSIFSSPLIGFAIAWYLRSKMEKPYAGADAEVQTR